MSSIKEISLRRATVADAEAIARVRIESWRVSYRGMIPDSYLDGMQLEESVQLWRNILQALPAKEEQLCVFVAESEGQLIGFASGMLLPEPKLGMQAELTGLYLLPAWQGCGIGRRMLQKVARALQALGAESLLVWVLSENLAARKFYAEMGAALLLEQGFNWDGMDLMEAGYGWRDLSVLLASSQALPAPKVVH